MAVTIQHADPRTIQNPARYGQIDRVPNVLLELVLKYLPTSDACQFKLTRSLYLNQLSCKDCTLHLKDDAADDAAVAKAMKAARKYKWQYFTTVIVSGKPTFDRKIRAFQRRWEAILELPFKERNRKKAASRTFPIFGEESIKLLATHPLKICRFDSNIVMLSARAFELLGQMPTLTHLEIENSRNYEMGVDDLRSLSQLKLRTLITHCAVITDEGYKHLQGMPLETLEMRWVENSTPKCLKYLEKLPLRRLTIESGYFTMIDPILHTLHLGSPKAVLWSVLQAIPNLERLGSLEITPEMREACREEFEGR